LKLIGSRAAKEAKIPPFREEIRSAEKLIKKLNEHLKQAKDDAEKQKPAKKVRKRPKKDSFLGCKVASRIVGFV
jgi:hypothetical protein